MERDRGGGLAGNFYKMSRTGECHHFSDLAMTFVFLLEGSTDPDQPRPVLDTQTTLSELLNTVGGTKEALEREGN